MTNEKCECQKWGRDSESMALLLAHHPHCPKYNPEPEIRDLLMRLIVGVEAWAADEDGIHPSCWEAYEKARGVVGPWAFQSRRRCADTTESPVSKMETTGGGNG